MAKIGKHSIRVQAADDQVFFYEAEVKVSTHGEFSVRVDSRLHYVVLGLADAKILPPGIRIVEDGEKDFVWVQATQLAPAVEFLHTVARDFITGRETHERVILYSANLCAAFYVDGQGAIHANGCGVQNGDWHRLKSGMGVQLAAHIRVPYYSVGFAAEVYNKITTHRISGHNSVRYERIVGGDSDNWASKLNSFIGMNIDREGSQVVREMPFTDEAAEFFYGFILGLCKMVEKLDAFLADESALTARISSGLKLLP